MPTVTVPLNLTKPTVGGDKDVWGQYWNDNADKLNAIHTSDGTGTAVGMRVGTDKVLNVEGAITLKDPTDITKVAVLDRSQITTATTRTYSFPDASGVIALKQYTTPTGTILQGYYGSTAPAGFVLLIGRTIGDAASGATERANADTVNLYTLFWTLGFTPTGGRGASAAADYAAHKPMPLPDHRGRTMAAIDRDGSSTLNDGSSSNRGAALGVWGRDFGVSVSGGTGWFAGGTFGGSLYGSVNVNVNTNGITTGSYSAAGSGYNVAVQDHQHNVRQDAPFNAGSGCSVSVSGGVTSVSASGATDVRSIVQPTIMVDIIIAL